MYKLHLVVYTNYEQKYNSVLKLYMYNSYLVKKTCALKTTHILVEYYKNK